MPEIFTSVTDLCSNKCIRLIGLLSEIFPSVINPQHNESILIAFLIGNGFTMPKFSVLNSEMELSMCLI